MAQVLNRLSDTFGRSGVFEQTQRLGKVGPLLLPTDFVKKLTTFLLQSKSKISVIIDALKFWAIPPSLRFARIIAGQSQLGARSLGLPACGG